MLERGKLERGIVENVDAESLVPKDHLLRKIDAAVDLSQLYEMVEPLYSEDNGRPSSTPNMPETRLLPNEQPGFSTDCRAFSSLKACF